MPDGFNWNTVYDRGLGQKRSDEERFVGHIILGFLAFTALYFALGVIKALLA